jgi:alpha-glucosidase
MTKSICSFLAAASIAASSMLTFSQATTPTLSSPDGQLVMSFSIQPSPTLGENGSGKLMYSVTFHGKPVIDNSALGLELDDKTPLGLNVTITDSREAAWMIIL